MSSLTIRDSHRFLSGALGAQKALKTGESHPPLQGSPGSLETPPGKASLNTPVYAELLSRLGIELTYHISLGTPAMQAIWVLLAKTSHPAELIQSHEATGVQTASIPFDIAAEYGRSRRPHRSLEESAAVRSEAIETMASS